MCDVCYSVCAVLNQCVCVKKEKKKTWKEGIYVSGEEGGGQVCGAAGR